jgi:hypothetical protein
LQSAPQIGAAMLRFIYPPDINRVTHDQKRPQLAVAMKCRERPMNQFTDGG